MSTGVMGKEIADLQVHSADLANTPLPNTEAGYRSHFIAAPSVAATGGPVAYVSAWLGIDADTPGASTRKPRGSTSYFEPAFS